MAEQLLRLIAGLFVGVWVARYLGPEQYGIFNYVLAFSAIFANIAKFGLDTIVVRELVKKPDRQTQLMGTAFWMKLSGAVLTLIIVTIATFSVSTDETTRQYILIITAGLIFQSLEVVDFYFQSQALSKYISVCKVAQLAASSTIKIYFVLSGKGLIWFVWVSLFDQFSLGLALFLAYKTHDKQSFVGKFNYSICKAFLRDSWPLFLSGMIIMAYTRVDQIMISKFIGVKQLGLYSTALRLSEIINILPVVLGNSLFPLIVGAKMMGTKFYHERLQQLFDLFVVIAVILSGFMTLAAPWIIHVLYGEAYSASAKVLSIYVWTSVPLAIGILNVKYLVIENLGIHILWRNVVGGAISIALNLFLIPKYGIVGAATAAVVSYFFANLIIFAFSKKTLPVFIIGIKSLSLVGPLWRLSSLRKSRSLGGIQ